MSNERDKTEEMLKMGVELVERQDVGSLMM